MPSVPRTRPAANDDTTVSRPSARLSSTRRRRSNQECPDFPLFDLSAFLGGAEVVLEGRSSAKQTVSPGLASIERTKWDGHYWFGMGSILWGKVVNWRTSKLEQKTGKGMWFSLSVRRKEIHICLKIPILAWRFVCVFTILSRIGFLFSFFLLSPMSVSSQSLGQAGP